jgi:hypothetical protein
MNLITLDTQVKAYADARAELSEAVAVLQGAIDDLKRRHLPIIKKHVARTAGAHAVLENQIKSAPHLFTKPRTITLRGITCGFLKQTGRLVFDDPDTVVNLIKKHYPKETALYIHTKESPNKKALAELPGDQLKKLGCALEATGDKVIIKAEGDVEALVKQLLTDACDTETP